MKNNNTKKIYFKVELNLKEPFQPKYPKLDSKNKTKAQCEKELEIYEQENKEYLQKIIKYKKFLNTFYNDVFNSYSEEEYDALKDLQQFNQNQAKLNVCFWLCCDELACSIDYRNLFYQMKCSTPQQKTKSLDDFKYQQKVYNKSKQLSLRIIKANDLFSSKQKQGTKLILFHFVALQKNKKNKNILQSDTSFDSVQYSPSDSLNSKRPRIQKKMKAKFQDQSNDESQDEEEYYEEEYEENEESQEKETEEELYYEEQDEGQQQQNQKDKIQLEVQNVENINKSSEFQTKSPQNSQKDQLLDYVNDMLENEKEKIYHKYPHLKNK